MDVVVNVGGKVVVDDVGDVRDIKTTSSDSSGDKDRATTSTEHLQSLFTLALSTVTVDGSSWEALVDKKIREGIRHALCLDEDQRKTSADSVQDVEQNGALVDVLDVLYLLRNVLGSGSNATNRQEDVLLQEIASKHLDVPGEGGGKHESLAGRGWWHVLAFNNAANLGLETHVQHAISLIENEVLDVAKRDAATLDEIYQTTGGSNEQVAAALNLAQLGANVGTTINDTWAHPGSVREFSGFFEDLGDQLTGGSKDQGGGVGLSLTAISVSSGCLLWGRAGTGLEGLGKDGEQETTSLSGTSLGTSHQVAATHNDRDRVFLDRGGNVVAGEADVGQQMVVERRVRESRDGLRDTLS
jgi:hypothetical protein